MVTLDRVQMDMKEFIVVDNLEDIIWSVRELLN